MNYILRNLCEIVNDNLRVQIENHGVILITLGVKLSYKSYYFKDDKVYDKIHECYVD